VSDPAPDGTSDLTPDRARRWDLLLDLLAERGRLSVAEVAARLRVSEATVRRDFTALAEQRLVTRTHGGVVAASVAYDLPARYRSRADATERIAAAAAQQVDLGMVVGFNGGRTTTAVARRVAARDDLASSAGRPGITVVTNALNIATEMVLRPHIRTVTLGGVVRPYSYELTGDLARLVLDQLWLDVLVLGVEGLDPVAGATCHDDSEAGVDAAMVARTRRVVVVAAADKVGTRSFARICGPEAIDVLVTDAAADPALVADLRAVGIDVVQV
jgi:DeoR family transcriptional regulator, aga operon transcriptional repressor